MFFKKSSHRVANIVVEDHVIRIVVATGTCLEEIELQLERVLPLGLIEEGKVMDEMAFYEFMKTLIEEFDLKKTHVRFYAPSSLIIMRNIEIPDHIKENEIKSYFEMEVGTSLHLPFEEPLIDVYPLESSELKDTPIVPSDDVSPIAEKPSTRKGLLFAVSEEEVMKYTRIFEDLRLRPIAVDVQALGVYRYYYFMEKPAPNQIQLFFEFNMCSVNISVFRGPHMEFLRFQQLDLTVNDWVAKKEAGEILHWSITPEKSEEAREVAEFQIEEIGRIMNFYQYSQNEGQYGVEEIILHGDYPGIDQLAETLELMYDLKVHLLSGWSPDGQRNVNNTAFIPVLGLALKGCV